MPCYDDRDRYNNSDQAQEVVRLRDRNHELTRLLCLACADRQDLQPEVRAWWEEHERMDAARVAEEQRRADEAHTRQVQQLERERERINAEIDRLRLGGPLLSRARIQAAEVTRAAEDARVFEALDNIAGERR